MRNLFYHAQKLRMPLLFHIGSEKEPYGIFDMLGLPLLEKTLFDFPDLIFIGHSASFWSHISKDVTEETRSSYNKGPVTEGGRIPKLMRMYPNLLADISANSGYYAITRDPDFGYAFLEEFQDRLFYGTDICAPREYAFYNMINFLDDGYKNNRLSKAAYEKINRLNAEYILK
jgi:predicted TIM-barrel fold metal-dependent hydrolase